MLDRYVIDGKVERYNYELKLPKRYRILRIVDMWPQGFFKVAVNDKDNIIDPSIDNVYISDDPKGIFRLFITNKKNANAYMILELSYYNVYTPTLKFTDNFCIFARELFPELTPTGPSYGHAAPIQFVEDFEARFSFVDYPRKRYILVAHKIMKQVRTEILHNNKYIFVETLYAPAYPAGWWETVANFTSTRVNEIITKYTMLESGAEVRLAAFYIIDASKRAPPRCFVERNYDISNDYVALVWTLLNDRLVIYISADGDVTLQVAGLDAGLNPAYEYEVTSSDMRLSFEWPFVYAGILVKNISASYANISVKVI